MASRERERLSLHTNYNRLLEKIDFCKDFSVVESLTGFGWSTARQGE
jgi:hypothetical protein